MHWILVGNPNSGKTSLFNQLTGLNQRVGNYPGITVDKRDGNLKVDSIKVEVSDLPGIYSLFPGSEDEKIAVETLLGLNLKEPPVLVCLVDSQSIQKNLLLLSQLVDFGLPIVGVLNVRKKTSESERLQLLNKLKSTYNIPWFSLNANTGSGVSVFKKELLNYSFATKNDKSTEYKSFITSALNNSKKQAKFITQDLSERLKKIDLIFSESKQSTIHKSLEDSQHKTAVIDKIIMHPILGYLIFGLLMLLVFQAIFSWAAYPMDLIDASFSWLSEKASTQLPQNFITNAFTQGIIPGIGGVVIFIPQIAFLFLFIALFEESGYMSRVVFLMDRLVKPFGLSGKSVVPLISGFACAIPAIMATRTIKHPRERLITMLVIPFTTCSARIPVYTTLIAVLVTPTSSIGPFNTQGLLLLMMYAFGALISFISAFVINKVMSGNGRSSLVMELPNLALPVGKNVGLIVYEKSKSFVLQAGKVILMVSVVLYFMANLGFNDTFNKIENADPSFTEHYSQEELAKLKLENSLIGQLGKSIEPVISPLGYDWKMGISLITSFAAREVFVGTMATIYALENTDDTTNIVTQMQREVHSSGKPVYSIATILSLLVFYALAMQCLSTVAIMVKESGGWKWAIIQLLMASGLAYLLAFVVYQIFK